MSKGLEFRESKTKEDIQGIYNFNLEAFASSDGFDWSLSGIESQLKDGWNLYSVNFENDIVAALFLKASGDALFTKNTPIRLSHQGNGFSHMIKEFYEDIAKKAKLKRVFNYCPDDNFRMIALNEGHNYKKTGRFMGENSKVLEWEKKLD